jgi:hypothetical protein
MRSNRLSPWPVWEEVNRTTDETIMLRRTKCKRFFAQREKVLLYLRLN